MKSVFDRLDAKPETVEITDPRTKLKVKVIVNKFVMQYIVANNIGTTVTARFPALFYRASKGDFTNPAQVWLNQSRSEIGSAMSYMMDCASGQTAARREHIAREAKGTLLEDILQLSVSRMFARNGTRRISVMSFVRHLKSDVPVLFISGTLDARTPISNAEEYRKGFSNSTHMIIEGAVHSDPLFLSSPKIKEGMMEFLRGQPVTATKIHGGADEVCPLTTDLIGSGLQNVLSRIQKRQGLSIHSWRSRCRSVGRARCGVARHFRSLRATLYRRRDPRRRVVDRFPSRCRACRDHL